MVIGGTGRIRPAWERSEQSSLLAGLDWMLTVLVEARRELKGQRLLFPQPGVS